MDTLCKKITLYLETGKIDDRDKYQDWYKNIESLNILDGILIHEFTPTSKKRRQ